MKVERAVNLVTIGLLFAVVAVLVQRYPLRSSAMVQRDTRLNKALEIDFAKAPRTLIMVVQQGCDYCAASMPFYRKVVAERNSHRAQLQIAVAAPQRDKDIAAYLTSYGVKPDVVAHFQSGSLPIRLTPTLLLAGPSGEVLNLWPGYLSASQEQAVATMLFSN